MSEIAPVRSEVIPWLQGVVVDLGCGRDKVVPHAIGVDFPVHYDGKGGGVKLATAADIPSGWEKFHAFCVEHKATFDTVLSSHLLEDYARPYDILLRWLELVRVGGRLILVLPIEQKYREIAGPQTNAAHKSEWAGAGDFIGRLPKHLAERLSVLRAWEKIHKYSFMVVFQRDR